MKSLEEFFQANPEAKEKYHDLYRRGLDNRLNIQALFFEYVRWAMPERRFAEFNFGEEVWFFDKEAWYGFISGKVVNRTWKEGEGIFYYDVQEKEEGGGLHCVKETELNRYLG